MINVYEKYKKDFWALFVFLLIYVLYCVIFWGRVGDIMIDCPREIYLPTEISNGQTLYTGIFSLYPPLGYYLNALFVKIFGQSLNLFYLLGIFNTGIILTLIYLISRTFSKQLLSFSITLLVLCYCCISYSPVTNYFFPYSYSFVYALTCFLGSIYLLILYFKNDFKSKFIILSLLSGGLSIALKPEFFLSLLPVLIIGIIKEKSFKSKILGIFLFVFPVISTFLVNPEGLKIFIHNFSAFCSSPSSKEFIKTMSIKTPKEYCLSTIKDISFFALLFVPLFLALKKSEKLSKKVQAAIFALCLLFSYFAVHNIYQNRIYIFSWLTIAAIIFFIKYIKEKNFLNSALSLILILSASRVGGYLASNHYGKYILPMFFAIFFCLYLPEILKKHYEEKIIAGIIIVFSLFSVFFFGQAVYEGKNYKIKSNKGIIYATKPVGKTVEETAIYIKEYSSPSDRVLVLPEGLMVNILAERKSDDMFYQLLPNHIDILGEQNIVKNLAEKPPEYVVLSSLTTSAYGKSRFCFDYANQICDYINTNYDYLGTFSNQEGHRQFMMMVLKLK